MSITIAYKSDAVGPICRAIAREDSKFVVVKDDAMSVQQVAAVPYVPQPVPVDPLVRVLHDAQELAEDFTNIEAVRNTLIQDGIGLLQLKLADVLDAMRTPAPEAPPAIVPERNVLIRWGSRWDGPADITINTAHAVQNARDKRESRRLLRGICPTTWHRSADVQVPCVIRPRRHHAGRRFYVCNSHAEVLSSIRRCGPGWYASELINKSHEYRVFVLQGRVVCVSERFPADSSAVAWNLAAGGRLVNVRRGDWRLDVATASIEAARRIGLDWAAVDVCVDNRGRVLVFEVNTAPGLKNSYTIEQVAWAFASIPDYATLRPIAGQPTGWRDIIHPSLLSVEDGVDAD